MAGGLRQGFCSRSSEEGGAIFFLAHLSTLRCLRASTDSIYHVCTTSRVEGKGKGRRVSGQILAALGHVIGVAFCVSTRFAPDWKTLFAVRTCVDSLSSLEATRSNTCDHDITERDAICVAHIRLLEFISDSFLALLHKDRPAAQRLLFQPNLRPSVRRNERTKRKEPMR
jgi:hypothetical protein